MYLERRTRPSANHIVTQKIEDEAMRRHRAALYRVQPQVDDRPPPRQRHLRQNAKKMVQLEGAEACFGARCTACIESFVVSSTALELLCSVWAERYLEIERDNLQLLARMHEMMKKGNGVDNRRSTKPHSLNISRRRKELSRITKENQVRRFRYRCSRRIAHDLAAQRNH